ILQVRFRKYEGKTLLLRDGEAIRPGDRIAEMHLDNRMLYEIGRSSRSAVHLAIRLIRTVEEILPKIAEYILNNREYDDVKGLYGISMINRGVAQLGFTVAELPKGVFATITRIYLKFLMRVVHPQGKERLHVKSELLVPKIIAMSRKELLRKYHPENPAKLPIGEPESLQDHSSQAAFGK
ncbi:MAG TPA: polysaccharide deacetylase family protein, partial [Bacilli bacterium]